MIARRHVIATAFAAASAAPARAAEAQWRIVTEYPASAMPGEGIAAFAEVATRESSGTLRVTPSFDGAGGLRSASMIAAVADGTIDAADAFTGAMAGQAAIFGLSALPFLTGSTADTLRLLTLARPAYQAALRARGLSILYATPWPATGLWSRVALTGPEALKGLRVRTYDATSTAVMRDAGALPVRLSFADAAPRLASGALDAVMSSGDGGAGAKLWDVLPHFTVLDYASPLSLAFCQQAALDRLPPPAWTAVEAAAQETEARQFAAMQTRTAANEARMRAHGVTIAVVPALRAALAGVAAPVIEAWAIQAGPEGAALLERYRHG